MTKLLVDHTLWEVIEPLIPVKPRRKKNPGRKPLDNRKALTGILFVLKTGIPWEELPQEMGCGSGMTCWRRFLLGRWLGGRDKPTILCLGFILRVFVNLGKMVMNSNAH